MKPTYAKSEKEYAGTSGFERKKILAAAKRLKRSRKLPTSIALEASTINELKALAEWRGVPYQVLMRMFVLDGLRKSQGAGNRRWYIELRHAAPQSSFLRREKL